MRDGRNGCQGLTTKAHGLDMKKVVDIPDFRSGVPLKSHSRICLTHALPIVDDLYQTLPRVQYEQADIRRTGIHGILQQLLDSACRPLNHFPRRDLIGDVVGQ